MAALALWPLLTVDGAGGVATAASLTAKFAMWYPSWEVVSLRTRSLFSVVKCWQNSMRVWLPGERTCHMSHAVVNTPMASNMRKVRSLITLSVRGSPPATDRHWIPRNFSHNVSMGSSGVHMVAMLVQLSSKSAHMMGPYVVQRWVIMAAMDTSAKPNVSSSSAARKRRLMASKSCFFISSRAVVVVVSLASVASNKCMASVIWNCVALGAWHLAWVCWELESDTSDHHVFGYWHE